MDDLQTNKSDFFVSAYEWIQSMVSAWVVVILIFVFIGRHYGIEGPSMIPTLTDANSVIVSNLFYNPQYKDVIVVRKLTFSTEPLIKRVIATEGQLVNVDYNTGDVYVDNVLLNETYINERMNQPYYESIEFPFIVPDGKIFVMGDNRNRSSDSRDINIGLIDKSEVLGKAYAIIWPLSELRLL